MFRLLALAALTLTAVSASAAPIPYDQTQTLTGFADSVGIGSNNTAPPATLTFTGTPLPGGAGTLVLTLFGDFDAPNEFADVVLNPNGANISLGQVLDQNTANDGFGFPNADAGNQYSFPVTGTASLTAAQLSALAADGQIVLRLTFGTGTGGQGVNNLFDTPNEYVTARLQYQGVTADAAPVPEPATLAVFGCLAAGAFGLRRRLMAAR